MPPLYHVNENTLKYLCKFIYALIFNYSIICMPYCMNFRVNMITITLILNTGRGDLIKRSKLSEKHFKAAIENNLLQRVCCPLAVSYRPWPTLSLPSYSICLLNHNLIKFNHFFGDKLNNNPFENAK